MTAGSPPKSLLATPLPVSGLVLVERTRRGDDRGYLERLFCADELVSAGWRKPVAQVNRTYTAARGTVRGLHFQHPPAAEMKLVICTRGEVFDVALDIRAGSPTLGEWHAERLSDGNGRALLIPEGFAHGFQALTDEVELLYLHTAMYAPGLEDGIHPEDPFAGVDWPLPVAGLSPRDSGRPFVTAFEGVTP